MTPTDLERLLSEFSEEQFDDLRRQFGEDGDRQAYVRLLEQRPEEELRLCRLLDTVTEEELREERELLAQEDAQEAFRLAREARALAQAAQGQAAQARGVALAASALATLAALASGALWLAGRGQ
jgi:hypothetical protein